MSALQFRAHADAARAQNASVVVENEPRMRHVDRQLGKVVGKSHRINTECCRHLLQFAVSIGDTDGTYVIAFDQKQFERDAAIAS